MIITHYIIYIYIPFPGMLPEKVFLLAYLMDEYVLVLY